MQRVQARVEGRVQGVGYRNFVQVQARRLQVTGWVRNCPDDTVELIAEGPEEALAELVVALEQGPRMARVDAVRTTYAPATGEFADFRVRY